MIAFLISTLALADLTSDPIKVDGDGYLRFAREGETVYAKNAVLTVKDGKLCDEQGPTVLPVMLVEGKPEALSVDGRGFVIAYYSAAPRVLGQLSLSKLPADIRPVESRGFLLSVDEGTVGHPSDPGFGKIVTVKPNGEGEAVVSIREGVTGQSSGEGQATIKVYAPDEEPPVTGSSTGAVTSTDPSKAFQPDVEFLRAGGIRIVLPETAEVDGKRIYLGALATVYANAQLSPGVTAVDLGSAPVMGVPKVIDDQRIKTMLARSGFDVRKVEVVGSTRCEVSMKGQTIPHAQFVQTAILAAEERYVGIDAETNEPGVDLAAPMGEVSLVADNMVKSGNTISVRVVAYVDGKRINSRSIKLYNALVPVNLRIGMGVRVLVQSNDVTVETSGKVKKIDGVTGEVIVELETGAQVTGTVNKQGFVVVEAW